MPTKPTLAEIMARHAGADPDLVTLTPYEAAGALGLEVKTLESWRHQGRELPFLKIGRRVGYRLSDVLAYRERHLYRSTRAALTGASDQRAAA